MTIASSIQTVIRIVVWAVGGAGARAGARDAYLPIVWPRSAKKSKKVWRTLTPVHSPCDDIVAAAVAEVVLDVENGLEAKYWRVARRVAVFRCLIAAEEINRSRE